MADFQNQPLLVLDGACGTNLERMGVPHEAWQGHEGCNEWLVLSAPDLVRRLHASMIDAGAQILETNTFGAQEITLREHGLADRVEDLNTAAVRLAREAIGGRPGRYVAGSIGPGAKLPSLGQVPVEDVARALRRQMLALVRAGVDALLIETAQDLLHLKTAVITAFDVLRETGRTIPVMASVTVEPGGTLLIGSDIAAVCAALEPFPLFSLGLNCATGPEDMESHLRYLSENWPVRISCAPNAGLPEIVGSHTVYDLAPADFARTLKRFVQDYGVSVVGGCCGTTPEHIHALAAAVAGATPAPRPAGGPNGGTRT